MLDVAEIDRVVMRAASATLKRANLSRAFSAPTIDSDGRDALLVTIVLREDYREHVNGENALDAMVRIIRDLSDSGEQRFPIVEFATEDELKQSDDSES